jgi:hypothetical protein
MTEKRRYRMRICDKNGMWWTVSTGGWGSLNVNGEIPKDKAEQTTLQCESLDGQSTTIKAPFSIKYYERGHKDKLVELLEKKLLEQSQQSKP